MYTVIRTYGTSPTLAGELKRHRKSIEAEVGSVPGFIAYYLLESAGGATAVVVCESRAGCDESTRRAAKWLKQNLPNLKVGAPQIIAGEVSFKFSNYPAKV